MDTMQPDPGIVDQLAKKGFAVVPEVLSRDEVDVMREHLIRAVRAQDEKWAGFAHYIDRNMAHNLMMHGQPFVDLLSNPIMHTYLSAALDPYCTLYAYTSSSIPAGGGNYSSRIHVDCPRFIPGYTTNVGFIVALDDFSLDNGATYFLPGSHLNDRVPTEEEFFARAERALPKAGEGVIFNARAFHFGGYNKTSRDRHAVTMNVCRSWMRQRFDYPRLMPQEMIDAMPEAGKRFIGWNVRVPSSLEQYYVPPGERMYRAGQG
jgi:ectoine hydroxylase-related dioxygenase (phytanoyl-CoA dioxygenase family)